MTASPDGDHAAYHGSRASGPAVPTARCASAMRESRSRSAGTASSIRPRRVRQRRAMLSNGSERMMLAAWTAAPSATSSTDSGTWTGRPESRRTTSIQARPRDPPPMTMSGADVANPPATYPTASRAVRRDAIAPSYVAIRICCGAVAWRSPAMRPAASGRSGVRSPSKYGRTTTDPAGWTSSRSTASRRAIRSTACVQLIVHARGRYRPEASANPATSPEGSAAAFLRDGECRSRGSEAQHRFAHGESESKSGRGVVAGTRPNDHAGPKAQGVGRPAGDFAGGFGRREEPGESGRVESDAPEPEDVESIGVADRRPPTRAGGVPPVCDPGPGEALGEIVMGQADGGGGIRDRWLDAAEPRPLRHGE